MTTDTFPKVATATVKSTGNVTINGISKGSGMIAPDMATMLSTFSPTRRSSAACCRRCQRRESQLSMHHGRQRYLNLRHAACSSRPARGVKGAEDRAATRGCVSPRRSTSADRSRPSGGAGRRRREQIRRDRRNGATSNAAAHDRRCRSPIRRWSKPPSPARTPTGAASSWPWARPARRRTGTSSHHASAASPSPDGEPVPELRRGRVAHMKGHEIGIEVDVGIGKGTATVWTCDLTHGYIDYQWLLPP